MEKQGEDDKVAKSILPASLQFSPKRRQGLDDLGT